MNKFSTKSRNLNLGAIALFCWAGLFPALTYADGNTTSPLGINIRDLRYWGTEMPTVDFFKRASNGENGLWLTQCKWIPGVNCWNTHEQAQLDLDQDGWPRSLPAADSSAQYRFVSTILAMSTDRQNPGKYPAGRWTVLYDGEGTLSYGWDAVRNAEASTPGADVFDIATPRSGFFISIMATDPHQTGNYLRHIRVIPPGGTCNNDPFSLAADASVCPASYRAFTETYQTEPFYPLFLSDLRPFSAIRYIRFTDVINDQTVHWQDRPKLTHISWGYSTALKAGGAPIEAALDIANTLDASPWLEIPARADDDYVTQFAQLAKTRLTTTRPIYLEYYNEAWNSSYPYGINGDWIKQQGIARWQTSPASDFTKQINWFGMRTKEICAIWQREFADQPGRVHCVMGAQAANSWIADQVLSCPLHAAETGGTACDSVAGIDAVAIAPYIGGHVANPLLQDPIESTWFTEPDGGLSKLFAEINDGGILTSPANQPSMAMPSLPMIKSWVAANKSVAERHHVALVAYEGGNELGAARNENDAYQIKLNALTVQANRDPRMGEAYTTLFNDWKAAGGDLFMVFESTAAYSMKGNSSLLEWQGQPASQAPKYAAAMDFISANPCWWDGCDVRPISYKLTVAKSGKGTVTSHPEGINCGSRCSAEYANGIAVKLTAAPDQGSTFAGWSGENCPKTGTCTLSMTAAKHVTATFKAAASDFVVTDISLFPSSPLHNGTFNVRVTVKNQGKASGDGGQLTVWANQADVQTCAAKGGKSVAMGTLTAGTKKTVTLSGLTAGKAGNKQLRAF
ncbi:MAG: InlB B-repeat-containing protein, partial [Candidatus Binatia bacterium]